MDAEAIVPKSVYKILRPDEWERLLSTGSFEGSVDDERDGFIHLSTLEQLPVTLSKHYQGVPEVIVAEVRSAGLSIRMEESRGGALFPHLYGSLPLAAVIKTELGKLAP